jgi:eukaryotic-like serine/threonine-protein kinase
MTELGSERNPVEALAEEFVERFRRGERPALSEYTMRYPELADDIRDLFPALVMLEDVRPAPGFASSAGTDSEVRSAGRKLERLGDYRILREVGRGGMGIVYEAEQESLGRHVALKVLLTHALHDPRQLQRFQREARAAARLHHTNIVPVFGVGEHDGLHYYVMQFITGQGLDQVLTELYRLRLGTAEVTEIASGVQSIRPPDSGGTASAVAVARSLLTGVFAVPSEDRDNGAAPPQPMVAVSSSAVRLTGNTEHAALSDSGRPYWQSVARIGIQVAEALGYAHGQGTLHRDIKPANLLLDTQGIVWITDFGLAKGHDSEDLTHTGDVVGTLRYLAPERFQGKGDARSDLYALGLTLYELLTLRPAFNEADRSKLVHQVMHEEPPPPRKLNPKVPRDLETIVLKAIAREPAHRYQNAAEFADDLRCFMDDKPIHARPVSETEKIWRWSRRNPALAVFVLLFIATLLFGSAGIAWKWHEAEERRGEAEDQKLKVTRAERETARQRDDAIEAHKTSQRVLAGALLDKGTGLAEKGEIDEGLFWMLEALKVVPENTPDLIPVIRTNLAAWMDRTHDMRQIIEQPKTVEWCAFSPDGRRFFTASSNVVQSWETATGRPTGAPLTLDGGVCAALSPDGKTLVTGINPGSNKPPRAQRWDAATGELLGSPLPHPNAVTCVTFSPDGKQFVTGCRDGIVRRWDTATGNFLGEPFQQTQVTIDGVDISPDGKTLVIATTILSSLNKQGDGYLVDLALGKRIAAPLRHKGELQSGVFSPTGKTVLFAGADGVAQLWDVATSLPVGPPLRHPHGVLTARFSPDGRSIVTGCRDGIVRYWDAATGSELAGAHLLNKHGVQHLAISPDGAMLLATTGWETSPGTIQLCRRAQSLSRPATKSRDAAVRASWIVREAASFFSRQFVSYSPDARRVLTGGHGGFANLTDAATGQPAYLRGPPAGPFRHAWKSVAMTAYSPDGRCFATSSIDVAARSDAHLWDAATGKPIGPPLPQINYVAAMAFSPDSKILATGGYDCVVRLWDTATAAPVGPVLPQRDIVLTLAFSPNSKTLAVGHAADYSGATGTILWDLDARKIIGTPLPGPYITSCFSPDGRRVLTATEANLRLWDASTGEPVGPALTEPAAINQAVFRSDSQMILLGCADGTVRLRDLATGKTVGAPMLHPYQAHAVAFSPDREGKLILAGYADGSARLWDRATQKRLGPPVLQSSPIYGVAFATDGGSFVTTSADGNTRTWPVPLATEDGVEQIALRLQVRTALEMGEGQTVVKLAPAEWQRRRELLNAPRSAPAVGRTVPQRRPSTRLALGTPNRTPTGSPPSGISIA